MTNGDSSIIVCGNCRTKNRVPAQKIGTAAKCGKCGLDLDTRPEAELKYMLRCTDCGAKNRVPAGKVGSGANCGKCGRPLATDALSAPQPVILSDMNFDAQVIQSPLPVLVYAWSPT